MLVAPQKESCRNAALFFVPPAPFRPTTLNDLGSPAKRLNYKKRWSAGS